MKTTMVARRRVCSPREGGSAAPSRGSAAAYRAGGRMLRPQLFLPTLVRAAGPGCRTPGGRMLARRSSCARRGRSRGGGGKAAAGGDGPAAPSALPVLGGGEHGPSSGLPLAPSPPSPPARSVRGRTVPGIGLSAENAPQIAVLRGNPAASSTSTTPGPRWAQQPCKPVCWPSHQCAQLGGAGRLYVSRHQPLGYAAAWQITPTSPPCPPAQQHHGHWSLWHWGITGLQTSLTSSSSRWGRWGGRGGGGGGGLAAAVPTHEGMESHAEVEAESTHTCVQPSTCCRAAPLCRHCQDSSALPDGCSECSYCRKQWVAPRGPASPPPH